MAHYEIFGGDVMKRSISNQITTQMSMAYLIHSLTASVLHISSLLYGPYPYWLGAQTREQTSVPDLYLLTVAFLPFFYATFQCGR